MAAKKRTKKTAAARPHQCPKGHPLVDDDRCRRAVNTGEVCK